MVSGKYLPLPPLKRLHRVRVNTVVPFRRHVWFPHARDGDHAHVAWFVYRFGVVPHHDVVPACFGEVKPGSVDAEVQVHEGL